MKGKQILPMLLAVCSSAMTAVGGYCALALMIIVSWNQTATHPIQTPFNALVGLFSLCFLKVLDNSNRLVLSSSDVLHLLICL